MKINYLPLTITLLLTANFLAPSSVFGQAMRLYGMTEQGGANGNGVIFQYYPPTSSFTKKFDFNGAVNGSNPFGSLMQTMDGNLYGMTYQGGANNKGVLFQYNPNTSTYTKKLDFADSTGSNPHGSLIQAKDGNLYGLTEVGGANNGGVLFQYNISTFSYVDKIDFAFGVSGPVSGQYPYGSLIEAKNGKLYGMTSSGGTYGDGILFQFDPVNSAYVKKIDFAGVSNGAFPYGSLVQTADGNMYGMTYGGGTASQGVLFQFNPTSSVFNKRLDFGAIGGTGTTNGIFPNGSLIQAADGNLYGMTYQGGANNVGVIFQFDPVTSIFTKLFDFDGAANGGNPYGSLMEASDGNLYGMTYQGGTNNYGILFQYDPVLSVYTKMLDFTGGNGRSPRFTNLLELANAVGIDELRDNSISLSPNPATDNLTIQTSSHQSNEPVTVTIMDVLGKMSYEEKLSRSNYISINIKDLQQGIYFLQLKTNRESIVKRFVKY